MKIVFFDGYCSLCNGVVDWLLQRDHFRKLKYASLQGATAAKMLSEDQRRNVDTVVYSRDGKTYVRSTAALHILMDLEGVWLISGAVFLIPRFMRDWIYDLVAKHRYEVFGKRASCRIPTPEEKDTLLP